MATAMYQVPCTKASWVRRRGEQALNPGVGLQPAFCPVSPIVEVSKRREGVNTPPRVLARGSENTRALSGLMKVWLLETRARALTG